MPRVLAILALLLLAACAPTAEPPPIEPTPTPESDETPTPVFSSNPFNDGLLARRNGDYARASAAFQLVLNSNPAPDLANEAQFRLAETDWLKKDYARAIPALAAILDQNPSAPRANALHYWLAIAYQSTKDFSRAFAHFRDFRAATQTLAGDTDAAIADLLVLAGDSEQALTYYDRALQDATLSTFTRFSILLRNADVHQGRGEPALAAQKYDSALPLATDAKTKADLYLKAGDAYAAANQLTAALARWNSAINSTPEQPSAYKALVNLINRGATVDDFQRGLVDYHATQYDVAIAAFERELKTDQSRAADAHYYLGSSYSRKNASTQAIAEFDLIVKSYPKRAADAYFGKAAIYAAQGKTDDAVSAYKKLASTLPDDARADDALLRAAQLLDRAKRYDDTVDVYDLLQTKYSTRESAPEALFLAGLDYYRLKDYKTAMARWQVIAQNHSKSNYYTRALYWLGKTAKLRRLDADAKKYWTQASALIADAGVTGMRSYYAWRAKDALAAPKTASDARLYDPARYAMNTVADRAEFEKWLAAWTKTTNGNLGALDAATKNDLRFRRGAELLSLDRTVEARLQFNALITAKENDPLALYALALYFQDNNLYRPALDAAERLAALADAANAGERPRLMRQLLYPAYYADLVIAEARANKIDPMLYFALIYHESKFNPWATADAGERGLAQIIPPTARSIAQSLKVKDYDPDQLFLPYVSVNFGVWYFAQGYKQFNDPVYALVAYNAGASRAVKWQKPDLDLALEEFEIASTALYVRVIISHWRQYQEAYK